MGGAGCTRDVVDCCCMTCITVIQSYSAVHYSHDIREGNEMSKGYVSKEYEEIIVKAMAYDLMLLFNEKGKDTMYTAKEIEHIIIDYVSKSLSEE